MANYGIKIPTGINPQNPVTDAGSSNTWIVNAGKVQTVTFTTGPSGFITLLAQNPNVTNLAALMAKQIQIELGSTATTFEAYRGNSIPINWQTEAGTIYGGTVTLNEDGSADLIRDKKMLTITGYESYNWSIYNTNKFSCFISSSGNNVRSGDLQISNYFAFDGDTSNPADLRFGITGSGSYVYMRFRYDALEKSVDNWINWLKSKSDADNPLQITIKLQTPETYHFDNIGQLNAFLGTNNVWADTGNITVTYIANSARFSFNSPLHTYNFVNLKLFGNTYIEHGKG